MLAVGPWSSEKEVSVTGVTSASEAAVWGGGEVLGPQPPVPRGMRRGEDPGQEGGSGRGPCLWADSGVRRRPQTGEGGTADWRVGSAHRGQAAPWRAAWGRGVFCSCH